MDSSTQVKDGKKYADYDEEIMMICSGGIISWLQGFVSENIGIQNSYIVGILCFSYLFFFIPGK